MNQIPPWTFGLFMALPLAVGVPLPLLLGIHLGESWITQVWP